MQIFGLNGSQQYAQKVANYLDLPLSLHTETRFEDGEIYVKSQENVRGKDVYIISSLYTDNNLSAGEKLTTLLFFIGSLKDASAGRITVISPYLSFSRQDRKTESRAPITTKYLAKLIETAGADRLLTIDVHNLSAFQNAFRIPTDNLEAKNLMIDCLLHNNSWKLPDAKNIVILSPDSGGMSRAKRFRESLEKRLQCSNCIDLAYVDKQRINGTEVIGDKIIGHVKDKQVIVLDDMISSGKTIDTARKAVESHGGLIWAVCATHGLFIGNANNYMRNLRLLVTDSIPPFRLNEKEMSINVISTSTLVAKAIGRTHKGGSISQLLQD